MLADGWIAEGSNAHKQPSAEIFRRVAFLFRESKCHSESFYYDSVTLTSEASDESLTLTK